jgi:hypothetical protein
MILKHDYLCNKLIEFVRKYNHELFKFHQEVGYNTGAVSSIHGQAPLMMKSPYKLSPPTLRARLTS